MQTILDEYNALRQNQDQLKAIANYRDDFTQLSGLSQTLQDHQLGFIGTFKAYDAYLNSRSVDIQRQLTKL